MSKIKVPLGRAAPAPPNITSPSPPLFYDFGNQSDFGFDVLVDIHTSVEFISPIPWSGFGL